LSEEFRFVQLADFAMKETYPSFVVGPPPPPPTAADLMRDPIGNPDKRVLAAIVKRPAIEAGPESPFRQKGAPDHPRAGSCPPPDASTLSTYDPFKYQPVHDLYDAMERFNAYLAMVSPIDMAALPFNKDVQCCLTRAEQHNAIFYVADYMAKDLTALSATLPLAYLAVRKHDMFPSRAEDTGTTERTLKFVLSNICNKLNTLQEFSLPMCAAILLHHKSKLTTFETWCLFAWAMYGYQNSLRVASSAAAPLSEQHDMSDVKEEEEVDEPVRMR
jgi:hypothetical protein